MKTRFGNFALAAGLALGGCSGSGPNATSDAARAIPMGPGQFQVSCFVKSSASCFNEAMTVCPQGYDLWSNVLDPQLDYGLMTIVVKCRSG